MSMHQTLNFPEKHPRWATDADATLEPSEGEKDPGWPIDSKAPARWMNWLQNLAYQWSKRIPATQLMNWWENTDISVDDVHSAIFHPGIGYWVVGVNASSPFRSADGHAWTISGSFGGGAVAVFGFAGIDNSNYIFGNSSDDIKYSPDAGQTAWAMITSSTIGGSGTLSSICTKYPNSDFAMLVRGLNPAEIRIASAGITGSWIGPTTPPPSMPATAMGRALIYIGGSTWLLLVAQIGLGTATKLYKSSDDGDTWTHVTGLSFATGSTGAYHMAYNGDSGRLIIVGTNDPVSNVEYIIYSDDLGDTWTQATIDKKGLSSSGAISGVYYCGGEAWIAISTHMASARGIYASTDNGANWEMADVHGAAIGGGGQMFLLACDQRKVMVFGNAGFNVFTLAS